VDSGAAARSLSEGAILLIAGVSILLAKKTRMAATYLGSWILLLVLFIYGPILIVSLADPSTEVKGSIYQSRDYRVPRW
jgi:hypothetical protein